MVLENVSGVLESPGKILEFFYNQECGNPEKKITKS